MATGDVVASFSVKAETNAEIADRLLEMAARLDLAGANSYSVRAY